MIGQFPGGVKQVSKKSEPSKSGSEKLERRKQRIIAAAAHSFLAKGYHQTGVRDIVAQAGISLGNFYNHFSSKEDVLLEITRIETQELSEFEIMLATADTPARALEQLV